MTNQNAVPDNIQLHIITYIDSKQDHQDNSPISVIFLSLTRTWSAPFFSIRRSWRIKWVLLVKKLFKLHRILIFSFFSLIQMAFKEKEYTTPVYAHRLCLMKRILNCFDWHGPSILKETLFSAKFVILLYWVVNKKYMSSVVGIENGRLCESNIIVSSNKFHR